MRREQYPTLRVYTITAVDDDTLTKPLEQIDMDLDQEVTLVSFNLARSQKWAKVFLSTNAQSDAAARVCSRLRLRRIAPR